MVFGKLLNFLGYSPSSFQLEGLYVRRLDVICLAYPKVQKIAKKMEDELSYKIIGAAIEIHKALPQSSTFLLFSHFSDIILETD